MAVGAKVMRNLGTTEIVKGTQGGMEFASLDLVDKCTGDSCPLGSTCKYQEQDKPCGIQIEFLGIVAQKSLQCVGKGQESDIVRVGVFMMPLYLHLVKLKMFEHGASIVGKKTGRINPIFKETRETIKALDTMLSKLGGDGRSDGRKKNRDEDEIGDPDFYESLFNADPADKKKPVKQYSAVRSKRRLVRRDQYEGRRDSDRGSEEGSG